IALALCSFQVGCEGAEKDETRSIEWPAGSAAQPLGVQRWVLRGTSEHADLTGFGAGDRPVAHAVFEVHGGDATVDFDLPTKWSARTSQRPGSPSAPPADVVVALADVLQTMRSSGRGLVLTTRGFEDGIRPR